MTKFKQGDKVRIVKNTGNDCWDKFIGTIAKIHSVVIFPGESVHYLLPIHAVKNGGESSWKENELELAATTWKERYEARK